MRRVGYSKNAVKVALLYPSTYQVAMSSAVYHVLYFKLQDEGFYVERFTADRGPRGWEDGTPLSHFDYVVATAHYELDYVNLVKVLIEGGVALDPQARDKPKVVVGGPPVTANPEPLAPLADLEVLGELEAVWEPLVEYLSTGAEVEAPGLYYPSKGPRPVSIATAKSVEEGDFRRLPEPEAAFSLSVELSRGCPFSCLFCMESYITKPYRPRDWEKAFSEAYKLYNKFGVRPSVVALTADAHPHFKTFLKKAVEAGLPVSLPSMRADLLDDEAVELMSRLGQRTVTIAPETSERLRKALGKEMSDQDVIRVAKKAAQLGMRLKIYLIVGLPCEREEDLKELASLLGEVKKTGVEMYLSVNPFIPKPQTPLQYHPMEPLESLKTKIQLARGFPHDELSQYDVYLAASQAAISLGGRDIFRHIEQAAKSTSPTAYWKRALRRGEFNYVFKKREEPLPWSHVRGFYTPSQLWEMYTRFLKTACS
ncbi:MAG: radical SAM protein [Pyrobaculum sp.]